MANAASQHESVPDGVSVASSLQGVEEDAHGSSYSVVWTYSDDLMPLVAEHVGIRPQTLAS